ncbi:MAG: hypothetical protein F9B45_12315 [Phycisphaera sp. RhM]|nr:hypothetical protein [Phycisphaera sp. RhM]
MTLTPPINRVSSRTRRRGWQMGKALALTSLATGISAFSMLGQPQASAAETACDAYSASSNQGPCDCGSCGKTGRTSNPIYKTLDTVAGGIEKLLGLDRCCNAGCTTHGCDGGCDSAPWMTDLESTTPPVLQIPNPPAATKPLAPPSTAAPRLPTVPPLAPAPRQAAPKQATPTPETPKPAAPAPPDPAQSSRRQEPPAVPPAAEPTGRPTLTPPPTIPAEPVPTPRPATPAMPLPEPGSDSPDPLSDPQITPPSLPDMPPTPNPVEPPTQPKKEGSIFDALDDLEDLDDPFQEDAARLRRQYGSIRPMLERASRVIAKTYQPVYPTPKTPTQLPQKPERAVGSGLRPVSHEEPIQLRPMTSRRVLAPYRPSR